ncbi:hypothetical protein [Chromobacterium haemolyticum]|uniref:hypothetical protein n=1 Tax=Chromobacterium haemolyticum TaxID=394935 RepID=UPI0011328A01|nr:hypothetical protein [Chromobacterium haemolyticum]
MSLIDDTILQACKGGVDSIVLGGFQPDDKVNISLGECRKNSISVLGWHAGKKSGPLIFFLTMSQQDHRMLLMFWKISQKKGGQ